MAICTNCGANVEEGKNFCMACGTPVAQAQAPAQAPYQPPYQPPVQQPYQPPVQPYGQPPVQPYGQPPVQPYGQVPMYVKPKIPGKGLGITALVLGIIGLVYGFYCLIASIEIANSYFLSSAADEMIPGIIVFMVLGILATAFGGVGISKGYKNGVSTSGLVMGIISVVLYVISIIICACA